MNIRHVKIATSNPGKLREYQRLAPGSPISFDLLPGFVDLPAFEESAPTFAENAAGKALHYNRFSEAFVLAEDSGLVVPALGGAPGVRSARYAGANATDTDRVMKLLAEMKDKTGDDRKARFVCVTALARAGCAIAIVSDFVEGLISDVPRGAGGFGYDPVFFVAELQRTFAEVTAAEKDRLSHRGKAFRKMLRVIIELSSSRAAAPVA